MAYTLGNIVTLARSIWLNDSGGAMLGDADAIIYGNRGCLEIAKLIGYPMQSGYTQNLPSGESTPVGTITLPSDFIRFVDKDFRTAICLKINGAWTALMPKERAELSSTIDSLTGTPAYWFPHEASATHFWRQVGITPKYAGAEVANGVSLNYICIPATLSALTGDGSSNEITEHFPIALACFIAAKAWGKYSQKNKNSYLALFETFLAFARKQEINRYREEAEAIPVMLKVV